MTTNVDTEKFKAVLALYAEGGTVLDSLRIVGVDCSGVDEDDALHDALFSIAKKMGYRISRPKDGAK